MGKVRPESWYSDDGRIGIVPAQPHSPVSPIAAPCIVTVSRLRFEYFVRRGAFVCVCDFRTDVIYQRTPKHTAKNASFAAALIPWPPRNKHPKILLGPICSRQV